MWDKHIVVTDLETTGLNPNLQEIIEIGAIKVSQPDLRVIGWMNVKVQMEHPELATAKALEINGYTAEAWKDALPQTVAMQQYADFAAGCVFAAHNVTFDWGFVDATMNRLGIKHNISYHRLDVLSLAWWVVPQLWTAIKPPKAISLKAVCGYLGTKPEPEVHRAVIGALTALRVLRAMKCMAKPEHLKISEAELDVVEKEIMTPKFELSEEVKANIGSEEDWAAATKAAKDILTKDEVEFT